MNSRQLINNWVFSRLNGIEGYTGKVARVVPAILQGAEYPLITYQFQNFRDIEYGNGIKYVSEAVILVKIWDRDTGFDNVDNALDKMPSAILSEAGKQYMGHTIDYVEREFMSDDFEAVNNSFYCIGNFQFKIGIRCLEKDEENVK